MAYVDIFAYPPALCFGKYNGYKLSAPVIRDSYFSWMLKDLDLDAAETRAIEREMARRGLRTGSGYDNRYDNHNNYHWAYDHPQSSRLPELVTPDTMRKVISAGRKFLAKAYHPDLGGDAQKMLAVNVTADYLEAQAAQLGGAL